MSTTTIRITVMALAALVLAAACQPPIPLPPQAPTAPVWLETDSIGFQYAVAGGATPWAGARWNSTMGATIDTCPAPGCIPTSQHIANLAKAGALPTVVIELGTNDAYVGGGWNTDDENRWAAVLGNLPKDTCAVVVRPYVDPGANPSYAPLVAKASAWLQWAADTLPNVQAVNWADWATAPGVLAPDGVHLAGPDGGAAPLVNGTIVLGDTSRGAYAAMLTAAATACG